MTVEVLTEEHNDQTSANNRMGELKKKNPSANYSVIQGRKSGKWHVVRHTSGGMHMAESADLESFDSYLTEATTLAKINKALHAAGLKLEVVRGRGYFYFTGDDTRTMKESGIYAWNILQDDPSEIVAEAKSRIDKN